MGKTVHVAKSFFNISERIQFNARQYKFSGYQESTPYNRRDDYKIWLLKGKGKLHYAARSIDLGQPAPIFTNPLVPYSFESIDTDLSGYMCIFTETFLKADSHMESLWQSTLFKPGSDKVFFLMKNSCRLLLLFMKIYLLK